jgi:uncharacterized protein (TIGR02271 family)
MTAPIQAQDFIGRMAVDSAGDKLGKIGQVYLDDSTSQPVWVTVSTGLLGMKESFAPVSGARWDGDSLVLPVTKDVVKGAPSVDADGHLEDSENDALYAYYAGTVGQGQPTGRTQTQGAGYEAGSQDHDTSGPNTDDAMTRSEERLHVGTEQVDAGRARLRKYIVTENVTQTVPVSHEEVRIEREPITDANRDQAMDGATISEEEHEVTLHAERPVTSTETVPVERVRLGTETVTEDATVTEQVRKEQIEQVGTHRDGK